MEANRDIRLIFENEEVIVSEKFCLNYETIKNLLSDFPKEDFINLKCLPIDPNVIRKIFNKEKLSTFSDYELIDLTISHDFLGRNIIPCIFNIRDRLFKGLFSENLLDKFSDVLLEILFDLVLSDKILLKAFSDIDKSCIFKRCLLFITVIITEKSNLKFFKGAFSIEIINRHITISDEEQDYISESVNLMITDENLECIKNPPLYLTKLCVSNINFSKIDNLSMLEKFYFRGEKIKDISNLINLTELGFTDCPNLNFKVINTILNPQKIKKLTVFSDFEKLSDIEKITQMSNLTSLNLYIKNILSKSFEDITGISKLINLKILSINGPKINCNFNEIGKLINIEKLTLNVNNNEDFSFLSNLIELRELYIHKRGRYIKNINYDYSFLIYLIKLKKLSLLIPDFVDINYFVKLENLEELNISGTKVFSLKGISKLIKLNKLNISRTLIVNLNPLRSLKKIKDINISGTKVFSLKIIGKLLNINKLNISRTLIDDLSPLIFLKKLKDLNISGTKVSSLEAISGLLDLSKLNISRTFIDDLIPLISLEKLESIYTGTRVYDFSILKNFQN